jgi:hypothetical protein
LVRDEPAHPWQYDLRPATEHDAAFIYAIRVAGLRSYVEQVWGWDDTAQSARFHDAFDPNRYHVIVVEGQDVGAVSVEWRPNEVFLGDIEILPAWRGRGLGTTILNELDGYRPQFPRLLPVASCRSGAPTMRSHH